MKLISYIDNNKCYDGEKDIEAYLQRVGEGESQQ